MSKIARLLSLLAVTMVFLTGTVHAFAWTDADYEKHDYESFSRLPEANQRIDMANVDYPLLNAAIFYETNRQRVLNGRAGFGHMPALEKAASGHSFDMVRSSFFSHDSPVPGRENMQKRLSLVGVSMTAMGENIADTFGLEYTAGRPVYSPDVNGGYFSYSYRGEPIRAHTYAGFARSVLEQWMNSPGHRSNILNPGFTCLGAGAAHYRKRDFYNMDNFRCTQNFAGSGCGK